MNACLPSVIIWYPLICMMWLTKDVHLCVRGISNRDLSQSIAHMELVIWNFYRFSCRPLCVELQPLKVWFSPYNSNFRRICDVRRFMARTLTDNKLSPNRELWTTSDSKSVTYKRNVSDLVGYVLIPAAHKPNVTEDGSPGIDDPDGAIQEYGTREHHRKQDGFLKNGTEKHNTHT